MLYRPYLQPPVTSPFSAKYHPGCGRQRVHGVERAAREMDTSHRRARDVAGSRPDLRPDAISHTDVEDNNMLHTATDTEVLYADGRIWRTNRVSHSDAYPCQAAGAPPVAGPAARRGTLPP